MTNGATDLAHRKSAAGEPAWDVALLFPAQGAWTENDYLSLNTNRMVEFGNGYLEVLPMPTVLHQLVVKFLFIHLDAFVRSQASGTVLFAPLPVRLWPGKFREPDIVYIRPGRIQDLHGQPQGADLVVEVVSEGEENRRRDVEVKRLEYARAGICEYWVVEPEQRQITVLSLEHDTYRQRAVARSGDVATSALLPGFSVAVDDVFAVVDDTDDAG